MYANLVVYSKSINTQHLYFQFSGHNYVFTVAFNNLVSFLCLLSTCQSLKIICKSQYTAKYSDFNQANAV